MMKSDPKFSIITPGHDLQVKVMDLDVFLWIQLLLRILFDAGPEFYSVYTLPFSLTSRSRS